MRAEHSLLVNLKRFVDASNNKEVMTISGSGKTCPLPHCTTSKLRLQTMKFSAIVLALAFGAASAFVAPARSSVRPDDLLSSCQLDPPPPGRASVPWSRPCPQCPSMACRSLCRRLAAAPPTSPPPDSHSHANFCLALSSSFSASSIRRSLFPGQDRGAQLAERLGAERGGVRMGPPRRPRPCGQLRPRRIRHRLHSR